MAVVLSDDAPSMHIHPEVGDGPSATVQDPFAPQPMLAPSSASGERRTSHRFSPFDTGLFSQYQPTASPAQAKRALEAHLGETDRRLEEASKLGTALVQQRKDLCDRLAEVQQKQDERELGPELRQKLVDVEKEYNELGRESARAFLAPRARLYGSDESSNGGFADGRRAPSPTKFASQGGDSPSKLSVPSRKQRNQPTSRVHDIEFATEISTSLLGQVRQLQAALAERDESLKAANLDKSRLEVDLQGCSRRLRTLIEDEQRYKDENWSLETQTHELMAANKEVTAKEQRLQQGLAVLTAEKSAAQRELDDTKLANGKLAQDLVTLRKAHESELASLRRNVISVEADREDLQRRVDELKSQNQELANAISVRDRIEEETSIGELGSEPEDFSLDRSDREHSPPPSPVKGGSRNSVLESETLRSSLAHAHRMIQGLKSNVHREKTEKLELKRMLQESRDELDIKRTEAGASNGQKRTRAKPSQEAGKKLFRPAQLGADRSARIDVELEDASWEEDESPARAAPVRTADGVVRTVNLRPKEAGDAYQTANETEDAFETANELDESTETEGFQTGAESLAGDSSDNMTETESGVVRSDTVRQTRPPQLRPKFMSRDSYISTASDSESDQGLRTPHLQSQKARARAGLSRWSRLGSEDPAGSSAPSSVKDSPASFFSNSVPQGQSLFAELGDYADEDSGGEMETTPSRSRFTSRQQTPSQRTPSRPSAASQILIPSIEVDEPPSPPRVSMISTGMMTDAWEPAEKIETVAIPSPITAKQAHALDVESVAEAKPAVKSSSISQPQTAWDLQTKDFAANIPTFDSDLTARLAPVETPAMPILKAQRETVLEAAIGPQTSFAPATTDTITTLTLTPIRSMETVPIEPTVTKQPEPSPQVVAEEQQAIPLSISTISVVETLPMAPLAADAGAMERSGATIHDSPLLASANAPSPPIALTFSVIQSVETVPSAPEKSNAFGSIISHDQAPSSSPGQANVGILGSVLGWATGKDISRMKNVEDDHLKPQQAAPLTGSTKVPFQDLSPNVMQRDLIRRKSVPKAIKADKADQSSQTVLSADQIADLMDKSVSKPILFPLTMKPVSAFVATSPSPQSGPTTPTRETLRPDLPTKSIRRPGSANSIRTPSTVMPPLPADHRQVIAAAAQQAPLSESGKEREGMMGPPLAPASVYRTGSKRPITPNERIGSTPRSVRDRTIRSTRSRRSSMSSFASELDERFNIRGTDGLAVMHGIENGADPRMIQAITQTMIGEYLWKYTRKAGRGEMSTNRHRRFFWVHPYTRTLYWSDQDPATAGRVQLKAKSVAIEAVRVVQDENPMPPGLHRKSLIVLTPGRDVKFTAVTGQRHETWFNALSYLLLRQTPEGRYAQSAFQADDASDFNPTASMNYAARNADRASLSTYNSRSNAPSAAMRHSRNSSFNDSNPIGHGVPTASPSAHRVRQPATRTSVSAGSSSVHRQPASIGHRISSYWGRAGKKSVQGLRDGSGGGAGSIYEASVVNDSAEDVREVLEQQDRDSEALENVRACCDGKHDVGSLNKRAGSRTSHHHHTH